MTSTWSRSGRISSRTDAGVAGLIATPVLFPIALMRCTVRCKLLLSSQWTRNELEPASANSSRKKSGSEIIKCVSIGRWVTRRRDCTIGDPIGPRSLGLRNLLPQTCKVGGKNRRSEFDDIVLHLARFLSTSALG